MSSISAAPVTTPAETGQNRRLLATRAQLTCLLVVSLLHLAIRIHQYTTDIISTSAALFGCSTLLFVSWVLWALRTRIESIIEKKIVVKKSKFIDIITVIILVYSFTIVIFITLIQYHLSPLKWTALLHGKHLLVAQLMIIIAGLSLRKAQIWLVAWTAALSHILLIALVVICENPETTRSMYISATSNILNPAWEFRGLVIIIVSGYAATQFCNLYRSLLTHRYGLSRKRG